MERWDPENRTHDRFVIDRVTASSNMLTLKDRDGVRLDLKVSAVDSQWTLFRAGTLPVAEGERLAVLGKIPDTRLKGRGKHHGDESGGRAADGTAAGAENHADPGRGRGRV